MSVKFGDVVIYSEGGKEYNALVKGERAGNFTYRDGGAAITADHKGKNGEPLLTLVFVKQRLDVHGQPLPLHGTGQSSELTQERVDVAHESHEYTTAQQKHLEKKSYDGGRWREIPSNPPITAESLGLTDSGDKKEE
jgi:hypothetical protein